MQVANFTFNAFSENTFILYDETKECCIIDPGCNNPDEEKQILDFIDANALRPVHLLNTHCHIDHVLGNAFIAEKFNLSLSAHEGEKVVLDNMEAMARIYAIRYIPSPDISIFLKEGELIEFGNTSLEIYFTPGHSPASVSFFHRPTNQLIAGDVLFNGSIGRTDLLGGNFETLISSIKDKFYPLGDDVVVYCGHGPSTTIGQERKSNPFLV